MNNSHKDYEFRNDALIVFWGNCQAVGDWYAHFVIKWEATRHHFHVGWCLALVRDKLCRSQGDIRSYCERRPPFHNANFAKLLLYQMAWCITGMLLSAQVAHSMNLHSGISLQIEQSWENAGTHKPGKVHKCVRFCPQKDSQCPQVAWVRHCSGTAKTSLDS